MTNPIPGWLGWTLIGLIALVAAVAIAVRVMTRMPGSSFHGPLPPLSAEQRSIRDRLATHVGMLAGTIGERSLERPEALEAAADYITGVFQDLGYSPHDETFESRGRQVRNIVAELAAARGRFDPGTAVQVQAEVKTDCFLNLQYESTTDGVRRVAATEQVLDGPVHQGNRHPVTDAPWHCVDPMAQWLHDQGVREVFAFDVAELEGPDGTDHLAIECNPRFNGASYPTSIARRLGIEHWLTRAFPTRHRSLASLDLSGIEYDPATGEGVILVNWGPILVGKMLCMLAGPAETRDRLALELERRL